MDVCKAQFLDPSQIHVLAENSEIVLNKKALEQLKAKESTEEVAEAKRQVCCLFYERNFKKKVSNLLCSLRNGKVNILKISNRHRFLNSPNIFLRPLVTTVVPNLLKTRAGPTFP